MNDVECGQYPWQSKWWQGWPIISCQLDMYATIDREVQRHTDNWVGEPKVMVEVWEQGLSTYSLPCLKVMASVCFVAAQLISNFQFPSSSFSNSWFLKLEKWFLCSLALISFAEFHNHFISWVPWFLVEDGKCSQPPGSSTPATRLAELAVSVVPATWVKQAVPLPIHSCLSIPFAPSLIIIPFQALCHFPNIISLQGHQPRFVYISMQLICLIHHWALEFNHGKYLN